VAPRGKTSRHRRYTEKAGGEVVVEVTPIDDADCAREGKSAVEVRILDGGVVIWRPSAPICLGAAYDGDTRQGRAKAADDAIGFFEHAIGRVQLGTLIAGTMRAEDLIPTFLDEIERLDPDRAKEIQRTYGDVIDASDYESEDAAWLLDKLFDTLEELAPEGFYFGAHPGDGADYGFWPVEDDDA